MDQHLPGSIHDDSYYCYDNCRATRNHCHSIDNKPRHGAKEDAVGQSVWHVNVFQRAHNAGLLA